MREAHHHARNREVEELRQILHLRYFDATQHKLLVSFRETESGEKVRNLSVFAHLLPHTNLA